MYLPRRSRSCMWGWATRSRRSNGSSRPIRNTISRWCSSTSPRGSGPCTTSRASRRCFVECSFLRSPPPAAEAAETRALRLVQSPQHVALLARQATVDLHNLEALADERRIDERDGARESVDHFGCHFGRVDDLRS